MVTKMYNMETTLVTANDLKTAILKQAENSYATVLHRNVVDVYCVSVTSLFCALT